MHAWLLVLTFFFMQYVLCVHSEAINYIHMILILYDRFIKFAMFLNVTKYVIEHPILQSNILSTIISMCYDPVNYEFMELHVLSASVLKF